MTEAERYCELARDLMPGQTDLWNGITSDMTLSDIDEIVFRRSEYLGGMADVIIELVRREGTESIPSSGEDGMMTISTAIELHDWLSARLQRIEPDASTYHDFKTALNNAHQQADVIPVVVPEEPGHGALFTTSAALGEIGKIHFVLNLDYLSDIELKNHLCEVTDLGSKIITVLVRGWASKNTNDMTTLTLIELMKNRRLGDYRLPEKVHFVLLVDS